MKRTIIYRGDIMTLAQLNYILNKIHDEFLGVSSPSPITGKWLDYSPITMFEMAQDNNIYTDTGTIRFRLTSSGILEMVHGKTTKIDDTYVFTSLSGQTSNYTPDSYVDITKICGVITSAYPSTMATYYTKNFLTRAKI